MKNHYICVTKESTTMKRLFVMMLAALSVLLLVNACNLRPLPERMNAFVNSVEKKAPAYTQDDWDAANEKFEALCKEYQEKKGSLTVDQIKEVRADMGRYMSIAFRSGVDSVTSSLEEIGDQIPGLIQEISDAVPGLMEGIGNFFRDLTSGLSSEKEETPAE